MRTSTSESGFTIVELLVASMITLAVIGIALTTFANALSLNESLTQLADSNQNLRAGTNLLVRDLLQAGRNIPTGGIAIPSGAGATAIYRPSPPSTAYYFDNVTSSTLSAITTGANLGPTINGQSTDIVTIMMDDSVLGEVTVKPSGSPGTTAKLAVDGSSIDVGSDLAWLQGDPTNGVPAIQVGDVLYFASPTGTTLQTVTRITSPNIYFDPNDPFKFNQRGAAAGSITQIVGATMAVRRVYLYTYFVQADASGEPRLMRAVNMFPPQALAGVIEDLVLSYDLVDGVYNPTAVRQLPYTDATAGVTYSASQIRKANVHVGVRSENKSTQQQDYIRNHVSTVVSLRNLAYVDRYQ